MLSLPQPKPTWGSPKDHFSRERPSQRGCWVSCREGLKGQCLGQCPGGQREHSPAAARSLGPRRGVCPFFDAALGPPLLLLILLGVGRKGPGRVCLGVQRTGAVDNSMALETVSSTLPSPKCVPSSSSRNVCLPPQPWLCPSCWAPRIWVLVHLWAPNHWTASWAAWALEL